MQGRYMELTKALEKGLLIGSEENHVAILRDTKPEGPVQGMLFCICCTVQSTVYVALF